MPAACDRPDHPGRVTWTAVRTGRFHQAAKFAPELDTSERLAGPPFNTTITKLPAGLVTIIYPFNWPLAILAASLPYALMAGNTVIVKPPPTAPLSSVRTLRHLVRALAPGVLNVVTGADGILGPVVVGDPRIKHVCFTGIVSGGRRIMAMAAANLTNVTLELGGNDPAIILDDADMDQAVFGRLSFATFMTTGQVCMAVKRLYVPRRRYDDIVDGLRAPLEPARVGPGPDPDTTMGPLNTRRQRDYVNSAPASPSSTITMPPRSTSAPRSAGSTPAASAANSAARGCTNSPRPTSWPSRPRARVSSATTAPGTGQTVIGWCHCSTKRRSCPRPRKPHFA